MSLFQCQRCGCCENTALASQGCNGYAERFFDWKGIEDRKGLKLCSACGPTHYADGTATGLGRWHNRFDRTFLPIDALKTTKEGNLAHIATGDEDFMKYRLQAPPEVQ